MKTSKLPYDATDVIKLPFGQKILYHFLILFFRSTGLWRYPVKASGDLETMKLLDKVYWIYKAAHPIVRAEKYSGLESFFEKQQSHQWKLPPGFTPKEVLSLSAAGDLMDHPYLKDSADVLYKGVAEQIFGKDISMANLECVIYSRPTEDFVLDTNSGPQFCYSSDHLRTATKHLDRSYTFLAAASNHSLDFEEEGIKSTIQALHEKGIAFNGLNQSEPESYQATILTKNNFKLGVVSYTFGLNAHRPPKDKPWIVNRAQLNDELSETDVSRIKKQLDFCKKQETDLNVIQLHWGFEHELYPRLSQVKTSHQLAEMGFDIIIGHHPHTVQPFEFYQTKRDPFRVVPIYYSLGNLINPFTAPHLCLSYLAQIDVAKGTMPDGAIKTYVKYAGKLNVIQKVSDEDKKVRLEIEMGSHN
ncbi:MAG: CapA family protein [Bacteriovoracia bacterium]